MHLRHRSTLRRVVAVVLGLGAVGLVVLAVAGGSAVVRRRVYPAAVVLLAVSLAGSIPAGLWLNESRHAQQSRT